MSESYTFGQIAEQRAVTYLKKLDYVTLEQNYRYRKAEIDIIARKDDIIVVVEVKARSSSYFGAPESFVNRKKIQLLVMAIDAYVQINNLDVEVRFDIISYLVEKVKWSREHIENAFYPF
jgi:putative endonuclease